MNDLVNVHQHVALVDAVGGSPLINHASCATPGRCRQSASGTCQCLPVLKHMHSTIVLPSAAHGHCGTYTTSVLPGARQAIIRNGL